MLICWYADISSCFPTAVGLAIRNNRHEYRRFLFSPVYNPFQQCPEDFRRSERFDTESEGGYRFKIVNLRLVSVQYADNALYFIKKYPAERKVFFGERLYLLSFVIDGKSYTTIKYIQKADNERYVRLVNHNPQHSPKEIPANSIQALALVKASIRFNTMG